MNFKLLFLITFVVSSCSFMKTKKEVDVERTIASIEPNQLKVDTIDGNLFVSINFEVFGKEYGDNSFLVHLPQILKNDLKHDLPYDIFINSNHIRCVSNSFLKEIDKNYHYRSTGFLINDELRCLYDGTKQKKIVSITYVFHKLNSIPIAQANSYIQPVNNDAKDASRILKEVKKGNQVNYFDERLLYDVFADKKTYIFKAKHKKFPLHLKLDPKDVVRIENPIGKLKTPRLGVVDYQGRKTKRYQREERAGRKYRIKEEVKPYEFFCEIHYDKGFTSTETFRWKENIDIYNAHEVKCAINTRKFAAWRKKEVKGQIEISVSHVKYQTLENKILEYLKEPQQHLDRYIENINQVNLTYVKKAAQKTIDQQKEKISQLQSLSKVFPFSIEKEFFIEKMYLIHEPHISRVKHGEKIYDYLDYHVYADVHVLDKETKDPYELGRIFLGRVLTSKMVDKNEKLRSYEVFQGVCGDSYTESFLPYLKGIIKKDERGEQEPIDYKQYLKTLKSYEGYLCGSHLSEATTVVLRRRSLKICGETKDYQKKIARHYETKSQIEYDHIKALYDLMEGTHGKWALEHYLLFPKTYSLEKSFIQKSEKKLSEKIYCKELDKKEALKYIQ